MKKKSQAAMEFLMTYGWAILVVLVAIGAFNTDILIDKSICYCSDVELDFEQSKVINSTKYFLCSKPLTVGIDSYNNKIKEIKYLYLFKCDDGNLTRIK